MHKRAKHVHLQERKRRLKQKGFLGALWYFLWYDNSPLSWVANIVVAFVIIKFIVYPLLGLMLGTGLPIVAVVSESMDHDGSFDHWWATYSVCENSRPCQQSEWYEQFTITKEEFQNFPLHNGFQRGDVIVLTRANPDDVEVGDTIVFDADRPYPIIHRVVRVYEKDGIPYYETKGDHNTLQIKGICYAENMNSSYCLDETAVSSVSLRGKALARLPYLGYVKILAVDLIQAII